MRSWPCPRTIGRDYEFATAFRLPIIEVIGSEQGVAEQAYSGDGPLVNSGFLTGKSVDEAKVAIIEKLEAEGSGRRHDPVQAAGLVVRSATVLG